MQRRTFVGATFGLLAAATAVSSTARAAAAAAGPGAPAPDPKNPLYRTTGEQDRRYDFPGTGEKIGYLKATVDYALKHPALSEEFRAYLKAILDDGKATRVARAVPGRATARR